MDKPSTSDVYAAIRKRFEAPAWALLFEVADATGARHTRWADAVAMGLWPSRGVFMHGMEVKSSRTDWVKELKDPSKAESVCKYCDYWWLVVADAAIVKDGELPANWGLLALNGKGQLKTVKDAPKLQPVPITHLFIAALLRSATATSDRGVAELERKAYWKGQQESSEKNDKRVEALTKKLEEVQSQVRDFERTAGFPIQNYNGSAASRGKLVRDVLSGNYDREKKDLLHIKQIASGIVASIDELTEPAPFSNYTEKNLWHPSQLTGKPAN